MKKLCFSAKQAIFAMSVATNPGFNTILWGLRYRGIADVLKWTMEEAFDEMKKTAMACISYQRN